MGVTLIFTLQKGSMWKRISAWLLDAILLVIITTLMALLLSAVTGYDGHVAALDERYRIVEETYGVSRNVTAAEVERMTEDELANLNAASDAIAADAEANRLYNLLLQLIILIASLGLLFSFLVLEFAVPMLLKNGQTIGKKVFGLAVMRIDGVRVNGVMMFIRTVLGKYTIETMIPVMMVLMIYFGAIGIVGVGILLAVLIANLVILAVSRENAMIHDKLACTAVVDMASQRIFDTPEALMQWKQEQQALKAAQQSTL